MQTDNHSQQELERCWTVSFQVMMDEIHKILHDTAKNKVLKLQHV